MIGQVVWRQSTARGVPIFILTRDFVPLMLIIPKERVAVQVFHSILNLIPGASLRTHARSSFFPIRVIPLILFS